MIKTYIITIEVEVFDEEELAEAAAKRAAADGLTPDEWAFLRGGDGVGNDLVMLLDPGVSLPGCQIQDSSAEYHNLEIETEENTGGWEGWANAKPGQNPYGDK